MFPAKSIMTTDLLTVSTRTPVYAAVRLLVECNITGIPVVDEGMHLLGMVSEADFLQLLFTKSLQAATVGEVMSTEVISFSEEDELVDICEAMITHKIRRVPIVKEGVLTGIISRRDIVKFVLRLRQEH